MSVPIRVIEIQERSHRFFPRTDLVDATGQSLILSTTRDLGVIDVRDVADGANLMALGLIGYLPLTSTISLNIVPRFPIRNFWTMLEIGDETYRNILPALRRYEASSNPSPLLMLVKSFCHYLRDVLSSGIERTTYSETHTGYYRPRVEFGPTINSFLSRGNPIETYSTVLKLGVDSPVNQIVKAACVKFVSLVPDSVEWEEERRLFQVALGVLQQVSDREPNTYDFDLDLAVSPRLRRHYSGMLRVYHLFLTGGGIAFTLDAEGKELPSFLFSLERIFEQFIRNSLMQGLRVYGIRVLDGNRNQGSLFVDNRNYPTKSDIVICRSRNNAIAVGDVKYKPKLKETDRYQIISHVTSATARIGILFTPANVGESQRIERIGMLSTGAQFYHYRINIQDDLAIAQSQMIRDVLSIVL